MAPGNDREGPIAFAGTCKSRSCVANATVSDVNLDYLSIGYLSSQSTRVWYGHDVTTRDDVRVIDISIIRTIALQRSTNGRSNWMQNTKSLRISSSTKSYSACIFRLLYTAKHSRNAIKLNVTHSSTCYVTYNLSFLQILQNVQRLNMYMVYLSINIYWNWIC